MKILLPVLFSVSLYAQATFEVASIKPVPPMTRAMAMSGKFHVGMKVDGARVDIGYSTLGDLIAMAFKVKPHQISGPAWIQDQRWEVLAKLPDGTQPDQVPPMLQSLLAERFGLKVHRETRSERVFGLEVAKDGPRLRQTLPPPTEDAAPADENLKVSISHDGNSTVSSGGGYGTTTTQMQPDGSMHIESSKMTMSLLCETLTYYVERPVIDLTNLAGGYVVALDLSAADLQFAAAKSGPSGPAAAGNSEPVGASLVASVQKLGLRLVPQQLPVETIVIDRLEKTADAN
ncbi:MAG TPA: TIGR03435 family protein [Bryobacteraceae bacterium]|jgi:uncharacterized protein (TIGR03435 family)